jgi:hypothetical protein
MPLGPDAKGIGVGYVNRIRMAAIAGIGIVGQNGMLIHSRYGSRLKLGGLLTTAALPAVCLPDDEQSGCPSRNVLPFALIAKFPGGRLKVLFPSLIVNFFAYHRILSGFS